MYMEIYFNENLFLPHTKEWLTNIECKILQIIQDRTSNAPHIPYINPLSHSHSVTHLLVTYTPRVPQTHHRLVRNSFIIEFTANTNCNASSKKL